MEAARLVRGSKAHQELAVRLVVLAINIIVLLSRVVDSDQECFATFLADLDHCDNDGVLDHGNHVDQDDPRLARVKEELGDQEGAEDLRAEAVQSSQAGESIGSSRRI